MWMATQILILKRFPIITKPLFLSFSYSSSSEDVVETAICILTHNRSKSRWTTLHSLYPNGFSPIQFSKIALGIKNKPHLALHFFQWTKSKCLCNHNLHSYSTIIHLLARARLKTHAQEAITLAIRASLNHEHSSLDSPPLKLFEHLIKTYRLCDSAPFVFDLLIRSCLESNKLEPSIQIVRMLMSRGNIPKVCTLNSLLSRVCKLQGFDAGHGIYREFFGLVEVKDKILKRGFGFRVSPNAHTYNVLMLRCYQDGLMGKVEEIWNEMGTSNCAPNAYSYTLLMAAFCDEGRMVDAERLWEEMENKKMELDVVCYNTIIGGFCKIGDVGRAEEFFTKMQLGGIDSTNATYEHFVKAYCSIGDVDSAVLVYNDMCRRGFRPCALILDMMVVLLCDKCRVDEAIEFLGNAVCRYDLVPKEKSYEVLIKGLCSEGKMEKALKLQAEMVGIGHHQPNLEIYSAFVDGYTRQGKDEMAESLRKEMVQTQMQSFRD
ncbi:pentatricopeptide repeat-containing protein At2g15980 [Arachis duranensis]|uniref:Pentatricopeptide repeat-containing protein At2g15980 n=1 Tax=Arachis duranensis TaxID=130453 RepID=A0A6P5NE14_ARADU|nr:pentatricopeptide repeat-containing protein At2g15980 [Arachis duranensis]